LLLRSTWARHRAVVCSRNAPPPHPPSNFYRYYENVTSSTDVKNQKSLRVKLTNDTAGEFVACRQGGSKFSFSSSPILVRLLLHPALHLCLCASFVHSAHIFLRSATDAVNLDATAPTCFSFSFSFFPSLKDALWTASGPATILGVAGTFQWLISPSSNDMVLTLHSSKYAHIHFALARQRVVTRLQRPGHVEHHGHQERGAGRVVVLGPVDISYFDCGD
jgi:hypothetical protein